MHTFVRSLRTKCFVLATLLCLGLSLAACQQSNAGSDSEAKTPSAVNSTDSSAVYMTKKITPESLMAVYQAVGRPAEGKHVGVKLSTGEAGGHNYLAPDLIKGLVQSVKGTIVECNTAYPGKRNTAEEHLRVAQEHGFTAIAPVDIMDAEGELILPVKNGVYLKNGNVVGSHFANYDFFLVLSHFKGHAMAGFGGALKNISIGFASRKGKGFIHSAGRSEQAFIPGTQQDAFLESMAEASQSIMDRMGKKIVFVNVVNKLSVDCDCDSSPADPTMADIGILASTDPVALDQACVDLVYAAKDGKDLVERMEAMHGIHTIEHAAKLNIGNRQYRLVSID